MGSAYSNLVPVTVGTLDFIQQPLVKSTFTLAGALQNQNAVSWDQIGASSYQVWRRIAAGSFVLIATVAGSASSYKDFGRASTWTNGLYSYYVVALDGSGNPIVQSNTQQVTWP